MNQVGNTVPFGAMASDAPRVAAPLFERLVQQCGATWVDDASVVAWAALPGSRVLLLAGDPVRFPEGQDVAAVLPELVKSFPGAFEVAVVPRQQEDAVARRYGSQRWPSLLFFRDGHYITSIAGMQDWDVYLCRVAESLTMPASRPPTIGVPVVSATGNNTSQCH